LRQNSEVLRRRDHPPPTRTRALDRSSQARQQPRHPGGRGLRSHP
jgi:hypothetical protein